MTSASTLLDKLWRRHVVSEAVGEPTLLYVDRHLVYEVTSPQAFDGLREAGRPVWRSEAVLATADHNVPTLKRDRALPGGSADALSRIQLKALARNCRDFGITEFSLHDPRQGIIHVMGPEQGATLPGMTVVAGDSHTSTHGAFGALAFGVGTSEVEHALATQCLSVSKPRSMRVWIEGTPAEGVGAKDMILAVIAHLGAAGAAGHAIEFAGSAVSALSMEGRMTLCNMAIEAGARIGLVAPDEVTFDYLRGRPYAPQGAQWDAALAYWRTLASDDGAVFDRQLRLEAAAFKPMVSWGTSPDMAMPIDGAVPDPGDEHDAGKAQGMRRALEYMALAPGMAITDIRPDRIFIGSCTNGRLEDLQAAAAVIGGRTIAASIRQALVVPGSGLVKAQAEAQGLDRIFLAAGFEWREPGCSMCLGMNEDRLLPGERCASTSNRNFEGRQGAGGRSHLVGPAMAAAAAIAGHFVDIRTGQPGSR